MSGADLEYQRMLADAGIDPSGAQGYDAARLEQLGDEVGFSNEVIKAKEQIEETLAEDLADPQTTVGSALSAFIDTGSLRSVFHDDFTSKPLGEITTGDLTDSGHAYGVRLGGPDANPSGTPPVIKDSGAGYHYLGHDRTNLATTQSFYLSSRQLSPSGSKAATLGVEFIVPAGADPAETLTLIISEEDWTTTASNGDPRSAAAAHFTFNEDGIVDFDTYDGPSTLDTIAEYTKTPWERGVVQRIEVHIREGRAAVTMPNGEVLLLPYNAKFDTQRGPFVTLQLYGGAATETLIHVLRWWADTEERTNLNNRGVQMYDLARATQVRPGEILGRTRTAGAGTTTAIANTLTTINALQVTGVIVPWTKRVKVMGWLFIQEVVPVTQVINPFLYVQCDVIGATAPGKQSLVYGSRSPYNGGSQYTSGQLRPFVVDVDLSAFKQGKSVTLNVKLAGSDGIYSFMDWGDGSGSASTLRQSEVVVFAAPAT